MSFPLSLDQIVILVKAAPYIVENIIEGKSVIEVIMEAAPEVLPIIEGIANMLFPGAGTALELVAMALYASHRMTPEEESVWFDRATGNIG